MSQVLEQYKRLKARRTALKGSATRKLQRLNELPKQEFPNKAAFDQSAASLQQTLTDFRTVLNSMTELCYKLPEEEFDAVEKDLQDNEVALENDEALAIQIICEFDSTLLKRELLSAKVTAPAPKPEVSKPKFKPRDLTVPKWNGDLVTLNAWKHQINDYFKLTGLTTDSEQLAILLYQNVLPTTLQSTLQDCTKVDGANGVWDRLDNKYPANSIPRAILQRMKETKPMNSGGAREMRRILEQIKDFARHSKLADCAQELTCNSTLDLIEQKLTTNLVRNFRRWLLKEHRDHVASVDLMITYLQSETELEERLMKIQTVNNHSKPSSSTVNQVRSNSYDCCVLCNESKHRFVDCNVFRNNSPQQRTDAMRKHGRCFTCLAPMHRTPRDCRYRRRCATCGKSHHTMLACVPLNSNQSRSANSQSPANLNVNASEFEPKSQNIRSASQLELNVRYSPSTIVELLDSSGVWHKAIALLDSGSDVTLIKRDSVKMLKLNRTSHNFKFGTAGGGYCREDTAIVSLWVRKYDEPSFRYKITAVELEKPAHDIPKLDDQIFKQHSYLKPIQSNIPVDDTQIDILIGFDYANLMKATGYVQHPYEPDNFPTGVETPLGWYIFGPKSNMSPSDKIRMVHRVYVEDSSRNFQSMYESDVCGVKPTRICACSDKEVAEAQFLKHVRKTIRKTEDGRIEVSLPWKKGFPECLDFNRDVTFHKLKSLENRLVKSNLLECYNKEMQLILDEYAEPVPRDDVLNNKGWYINHFPILRPGKSTSCRIVWNSAAVFRGVSLNDGLFKGPDLLNNLFCVLLVWRKEAIAITGDIRKMFNQTQFAPLSLKLRLLLQSLWQQRVSWDEELPSSIYSLFSQMLQEIQDLKDYRIPRRLVPDLITNPIELHGFCDGGELAYGAVIYLRFPTELTFDLRFVCAKAYVAPLKKRSIPRLELMAAVILVRLVAVVRTVVNVENITLWTDSATVLSWLHMPASNFKPFVSTRVQEILETVPEAPDCFRYVKSSLNPADALTKKASNLNSSLWHQGPEFLLQSTEHWPCE